MAIITVTTEADSGPGSLRDALAAAAAGDLINFAAGVTQIDLASSLIIFKNVTIEGSQPGSIGTPEVTVNGGDAISNFSDFIIKAGVKATIDGLIIADGHAVGATGTTGLFSAGPGGAAAGGIYDAGALRLTNSLLRDDTATGGAGGQGPALLGGGGEDGGAGGNAAGAIYVAGGGSLSLSESDRFSDDSAIGGSGGSGGGSVSGGALIFGGAGGAGGTSGINGGIGSPGSAGSAGSGSGGDGGSAFANVGGAGTIIGSATLVVTTEADSGPGSLRYELAVARAGDKVVFDPSVTTIDLASSLVVAANVIIEGSQPGSIGTPGVTINGGGPSSNFSDFIINAGVNAALDGLIIANGHAVGAAGATGLFSAGSGGAAAGGIYDAGALRLTNSVLRDDTATGGDGGLGPTSLSGGGGAGGGAGGDAAGAIYVASGGSLGLSTSDRFSDDTAAGGSGGSGGGSVSGGVLIFGGAGGAGRTPGINGGIGSPGSAGTGAGGAPGESGSSGGSGGSGGGGGGGSAFANVGGAGAIRGSATLVVTNDSDDINRVGSLRYELAVARTDDKIVFDPSVRTIDLASSLVVSTDLTIEGSQPGSTGAPGVTINGGGSTSNFSDFIINAGVNATFDGLVIANGHATGIAGIFGAAGGAAAGGIFDAGVLTLTNSVLLDDTATGGAGGSGQNFSGGGAGGNAAGAIYVAATGTLSLSASDHFGHDSAVGGDGGSGGAGFAGGSIVAGGAGGSGGVSGMNGGVGSPGSPGAAGAAGGAPGEAGSSHFPGPGGGGGGGFAFGYVGGEGTLSGPVPCYCPGTLIRTAYGEKRVEQLAIGDKVMTMSGALRPIKWIGRRSYRGRFVMGRKDILPVCIKAGALDDNIPRRDLWISPHHAMYFEHEAGGVLIEAKDLVNGISIAQAEQVDVVEYVHVELDTHDVILAEGARSETFVDDDSRGLFHNAHEFALLYPDEAIEPARYCAPRRGEGFVVEAVRLAIARRAGLVASPADAGELRGGLDFVDTGLISGWAQNVDHPEAPVCLDIYAGGRLIGQTLANLHREDLQRAGIGSGNHGFEFRPARDVALADVAVRRSIDGVALGRGETKPRQEAA
jgi:hypothetical protein